MMTEEQRKQFWSEVKRGLLIGGAVGVLGGLFFMDMRRGLALGLIGGFFAVLTRRSIEKRRGR
ncbi:MAG: hypothetical protein B193_2438 [Solidesulfovibrio magneticus str. Maddingley MBC34]|uniref:Uncharacterized protein n=1 Tax=Solidesulfovibrio magneticus str. Maddingley MBC34 TaxID=1206767 RepID=K6H8M0_9BACT|nr:MAG: hypothetical protein B193_2438 [Solidesulfovibrio magneticus str. Maddingley MBC34]